MAEITLTTFASGGKLILAGTGDSKADDALGPCLLADRLVARSGGVDVTLHFGEIAVPERLLVGSGAARELKSADALKAEIVRLANEIEAAFSDAIRREAKTRELELVRACKVHLRQALRARALRIDAAANMTFLGVTTLAGAVISGEIDMNLAQLAPEGAADGGVLLHARVEATAQFDVAGKTYAVRWGLAVAGTAEGAFSIVPSMAWPSIPDLPLSFTSIGTVLPRLSLDNLEVGKLAEILRFDLPLPVSPISLRWEGANGPPVNASVTDGDLNLRTGSAGEIFAADILCDGDRIGRIERFSFAFSGGRLNLTGLVSGTASVSKSLSVPTTGGDFLPVTVSMPSVTLTVAAAGSIDLATASSAGAKLSVTATLEAPRLEIRAKTDPSTILALAIGYEFAVDAAGRARGRLTRLDVIEPYPVRMIAAVSDTLLDGITRLVGLIEIPKGDVSSPLLDRLGELLASAMSYFANLAGDAARALIGVAKMAADLLGQFFTLIRRLGTAVGTPLSHMAIEVRLDARTLAVRQVVIAPAKAPAAVLPNATARIDVLGFRIIIPASMEPALLIDLSGDSPVVAFIIAPVNAALTLSTDLWLKRHGAGTEAVRDSDAKGGTRREDPLIRVEAETTDASPTIAIFMLSQGKLGCFRKVEFDVPPRVEGMTFGGDRVEVRLMAGRPRFLAITPADATVKVGTADDATDRLLPFLGTPKAADSGGGGLVEKLGQHVRIRSKSALKAINAEGKASLPVEVEIVLGEFRANTILSLEIDIEDLTARLRGGDTVAIRGRQFTRQIYGLNAVVKPKVALPDGESEFEQFVLDFSGGDVRLGLSPSATVDLTYPRIASRGRGLVFKVDSFAVARNVFDIEARVDPDEPVTIAGVGMPFRFAEGGLSIKRGKIQAFSIKGTGQLPPALVGDANATVRIAFSRGADDRLVVQSAEAELDKSNDPLICHGTRFKITISKLGFDYRDFGADGGYQFFFTLTGAAEFTPRAGEFSSGLLKYLPSLKITLDKAPLANDARLLSRAIEFQVAVEPRKRVNFFELFTFELRGVGFHPASPAFGEKPAMSISGQVNFVEGGDIVSPKFDFHKLWIAPPREGQSLPQIRFDGLTLGLRLGGAASVEGTAIAVDDRLPTIYPPDTLPADVTARGFLASGRLSIKGWATMAAAMGFLELERPGQRPRHAFFLYGQAEELSVTIPTPIGNIYLREVGFGFGYRFTLAGLARADRVTNPDMLVQVLDDVSKYQGDLHKVRAWQPQADANQITLAMRAMFSLATASPGSKGVKASEKTLSNPVLFDVAAALRSDLTFLMTVRAWIAVNYWTWAKGSGRDTFADKPGLRGYLYISAPRQEFLARMIADPQGHIGETPKLPAPLISAMRNTYWSSTLYIRPGLFHQEFGWPYELGFDLKHGNNLVIRCRGGMITRIEDFSLLYGIAFKAEGFAEIGGSVGGRSLGASVTARADFQASVKLIAYLSLKRAGDTLFYGSLSFSVTVSFGVRIWLEFSIGFTDIHLEISFAIRLTITLALEVAVKLGEIGGRGSASIAVSAFGRTLRVGAGFGFNQSLLNDARAQVERFLALGLSASVPDPARGLEPPPPSKANTDANATIDRDAEKADAAIGGAAPSPGVKPDITGAKIGSPRFWAMLFEVVANPGTYVMTLVPRDRTDLGALRDFELADGDSTFFAPPPGADGVKCDYKIETGAAGLVQLCFDDKGKASTRPMAPNASHTISANNPIVVYQNTAGKTLSFADFIRECFVLEWKDGKPGGLLQPASETILAKRAGLPSNADARDAELREAALDQVNLSASRQAWRDVEERRSAVIAALADSAARLAAEARMGDGGLVWPERPKSGIDVRDFGVTFVVTAKNHRELQDGLFERNGQTSAGAAGVADVPPGPPVSTFKITGRKDPLAEEFDEPRPVHLFNPLDRMFREADPTLAPPPGATEPRLWREGGAIKLDWDLEPAWSASTGVWDDPEFQLKHYRIDRKIIDTMGLVGEANPPGRAPITNKAGAPLRSKIRPRQTAHSAETILEWEAIRPEAQFADDLADVPQNYREAILHVGERPWKAAGLITRDLRIAYTIIPVDISGTEGTPIVLEFRPESAPEPPKPIAKAEMVIHYREGLAKVGEAASPTLDLRIDDTLFRAPEAQSGTGRRAPQRHPGDNALYQLKIRRERAYPAGLYGADALTQARQRPGPADFERDEVDDAVFDLVFVKKKETIDFDAAPILEAPGTGQMFFKLVNPAKLATLREALGIGKGHAVRPVRLAVRRLVSGGEWPPPKGQKESLKSTVVTPWCVIDTILRIGGERIVEESNARVFPVDSTVEVFEHPRRLSFKPLDFDNLDGEAGRLLVVYPAADADIRQLLTEAFGEGVAGAAVKSVVSVRDPSRRIGTRLRWNARPFYAKKPEFDDRDLIGGFDLFEVDMTALPDDDSVARLAQPAARVQVLPSALAKLDPAQIDDYGKIEAFYPSETLRLSGAKPEQASPRPPRRAPWYSLAESIPVFPRLLLRRSLAIDHEQAPLTALFACGRPVRIRVDMDWDLPNLLPQEHPAIVRELRAADGAFVHPEQQPDAGFAPRNGGQWSSAELTDLLRSVWWEASADATRKIDGRFVSHPVDFADAKVKLTARDASGGVLAEVELAATLDPPLHPLLADVIDELNWGDKTYRRYSPVLDGAPETKAAGILAFLDERPTERDPFGWAILRTLGLATGLRLYDSERGDYVEPLQLLELVASAIRRIHRRYAGFDVGAPIVEVLARSDGLMTVASFDEANPAIGQKQVYDLVHNESLAMVQISLRPTPDRWAYGAQSGKHPGAVHYVLARRNTKAPPENGIVKIKAPDKQDRRHILVEIIDITRSLGGARTVALAHAQDPIASTWADTTVREHDIDVAGVPPGSVAPDGKVVPGGPAALLRVTLDHPATVDGNPVAELGDICAELTFESIPDPGVFGKVGQASPLDPFERFDPMPARRTASLVFGVMPGSVDDNAGAQSQQNARFGEAYRSFAEHAKRRFAADWPDEMETASRTALVERLMPWLGRFLVHGPSDPPGVERVPFALATLTRPDPWRVEPQVDGTIEVMLTHKDRFARRRRYIVRPFNRYESFVTAFDSASTGDGGVLAAPTLLDLAQETYKRFDGHSVDVTVPRTEPLSAPLIVSAKRLDLAAGDTASGQLPVRHRPGRALEIVLSRHDEELISEANRAVADGLQFEHVALGFWREFASPDWARIAWETAKRHGASGVLDLVPEIGTSATPEPAPLSFASSTSFERDEEVILSDGGSIAALRQPSLPERIDDGWRGITALRIRDLPHFYRVHAVAYASAGVTVSPPAAAVITEGYYENRLPWEKVHAEDGEDRIIEGGHGLVPTWSIDRGATTLSIVFEIPLARFIDGMAPEDRRLWKPAAGFPAVFGLPDPAVSYLIALQNRGDGGLATEIELMPLPVAVDNTMVPVADQDTTYAVVAPGTVLEPSAAATPNGLYIAVPGISSPTRPDEWLLKVPTKLRTSRPDGARPHDSLKGDWIRYLGEIEVPAEPPPGGGDPLWIAWRELAPIGSATITITRPADPTTAAKWQQFMSDIAVWITAYGPYGADDQAVVAQLQDFATGMTDQKWLALAGTTGPLPVTIERRLGGWRAGLPILQTWIAPVAGQRPAAVSVAVNAWDTLADGASISGRNAVRTVLGSGMLLRSTNFDAFREIAMPFIRELGARNGLSRVAGDASPFAGAVPSSAAIPPDLIETAQRLADQGAIKPPVDLIRLVALRTKQGAGTPFWDGVNPRRELLALFEALEGYSVTLSDGTRTSAGTAAALVALSELEVAGKGFVSLPLPHHAMAPGSAIRSSLDALATLPGVESGEDKVTAIVLRRPPLATELPQPDAAPGGAEVEAFAALVKRCAEEQLFGVGRRPILKVYRGIADPVLAPVGRKKL